MLYITLLCAISVLIAILILHNIPVIKGKLGEKSVAVTLSRLPKGRYIVLNNILLKKKATTAQIDHLVISTHGIFVIETKNHKGWIYGSKSKYYWTQNIYGNKYQVYNPVLQNQNHIRFLVQNYDCFKRYEPYIHNVVVYTRASRLIINDKCVCVVWRNELIPYINSQNYDVIDWDDCNRIAAIIRTEQIKDRTELRRHNKNAQNIIHMNQQKIEHGICPQCGAKLIRKAGRYGYFYGCSRFPACHYTL